MSATIAIVTNQSSLVAIVPESIYVSDKIGLKTGSGGCVRRNSGIG